ncbi:hypothetical protein QUA21_30550 [Microcoleus sp. Pol1B3]|uniref:hypothetical protein n=1 Tax=unclassified Microcoleus TaxID=2642155 RepID=UPI002FD1F548
MAPKWGTSSGTNPEENFDEPEDLSDVVGLDAEIPRGSARPTGSLLQPKPKPRSPIGVEIGKSAGGGLGVTVSLPIGGPISGRGGINLGAGGAIKGGSLGLGFGIGPIGGSIDVGTDQDENTGEGGCYQYVTLTVGPFSHTYGRNVCEPKQVPPQPAPTAPEPTPFPATPEQPAEPTPPDINCSKTWITWREERYNKREYLKYNSSTGNYDLITGPEGIVQERETVTYNDYVKLSYPNLPDYSDYALANRFGINTKNHKTLKVTENPNIKYYITSGSTTTRLFSNFQNANEIVVTSNWHTIRFANNTQDFSLSFQTADIKTITYIRGKIGNTNVWGDWKTRNTVEYYVVCGDAAPIVSTPVYSPMPPNSPPKKKMDDKCCKAIMLMLLMQHKHLGVTPIPGMEALGQFAQVSQKGEQFETEKMAFPFEVPKRWLDPVAKKEEKILVKNVSELLFIMGSQSERLERVVGTKEFIKDSEGKLRQSEGNLLSWLTGNNPDFAYPDPNDFWLNTDDGIIKEKRLEVRSLTDAIRYVVEMGNRLERILPIAELKDSSIPKRWIYPGAKGQERVGNLIHLIELMVRSDDKHRGYWPVKVKVKDADPAIKGDQPIELEFHSQADVFRELFQYLIDMEGDGDLTSNFALRSAFQQCQMHQLTVQNNAMLDAIVEYLDFKINRTTADVPMPFDPFAGMDKSLAAKVLEKIGFGDGAAMSPKIDSNKESDIEALAPGILQNTIVKVDIVECAEDKTLNEALLELLKHSSAASAAVSERVSEAGIDRLIAGAGLAQKITSFLMRRDVASALGIGDLDKWIGSAEVGYTDNPETQALRFPESDPLQPYNRPITENPRIREIDTKEPKAD